MVSSSDSVRQVIVSPFHRFCGPTATQKSSANVRIIMAPGTSLRPVSMPAKKVLDTSMMRCVMFIVISLFLS